jgi:hypothetical protein
MWKPWEEEGYRGWYVMLFANLAQFGHRLMSLRHAKMDRHMGNARKHPRGTAMRDQSGHSGTSFTKKETSTFCLRLYPRAAPIIAPSIATTVAEMLANPNRGALADVVVVVEAEVDVALEVMKVVVDIGVALMLPLAVNVSAAVPAVVVVIV